MLYYILVVVHENLSVAVGQLLNSCFLLLLAQVSVRVTTVDAELEFAIQSSTTGKQLFDQVQTHTSSASTAAANYK